MKKINFTFLLTFSSLLSMDLLNLTKTQKNLCLGQASSAFSTVILYPLDTAKTRLQANINVFDSSKGFLSETKKLFQGVTSSMARNALRGSLNCIGPNQLPGYVGQISNGSLGYEMSQRQKDTMAGLSWAILDFLIFHPFDRVKTWAMTSGKLESGLMKEFFKANKKNVSSLYKGGLCNFPKQVMGKIGDIVLNRLRLENQKDSMSNGEKIFHSVLYASAQAASWSALLLPIDAVKTQVQCANTNYQSCLKDTIQAGKDLFNKRGLVKGFYAGFGYKTLTYILLNMYNQIIRDWSNKHIQ